MRGTDQIQQKIQAAAADLATALTSIRQRAPHARVYVVGYPAIEPLIPDTAAAPGHPNARGGQGMAAARRAGNRRGQVTGDHVLG